ncbi:VOC family protein [Streptomyces megasporus]|uniref:VOC family protein n=1 Tax=Streptomyces megasporus TaxID=44060 RepID=UPI000569CADF|nr:VOC family protein [Streptomyces megasporus]
MTETARVPQGAPCWVTLLAPHLEAARHFYGELLGWHYRPGSQGLGPYEVALSEGVPVAGLGEARDSLRAFAAWTAYFAADSVDVVAGRVRERGATVAVGPVRFGAGRVAWAADPAGAVFGIWEGAATPGWRVGGRVNGPAWLELMTRDAFAAALFYGEVFGWDLADPDRYDIRYEHDRVILRIDKETVAGLSGGAVEDAPDPRIRPHWHVHFRVEDVEASAAKAASLGAEVVSPPAESPTGRLAVIRDPQGALFSIESAGA